jgi:hypothetical protein
MAVENVKLDAAMCWNEQCEHWDTSHASRCSQDAPLTAVGCECQFDVCFKSESERPNCQNCAHADICEHNENAARVSIRFYTPRSDAVFGDEAKRKKCAAVLRKMFRETLPTACGNFEGK